MSLKLYYDLMSQPSRALYIFLKVNNIPFEPVSIRLGNGQHRQEEFKKINPLQLVPVIDDNGFILRESVGILRYLCREKNVPDHWYPKDSREQARVDEYLEWQHLGVRLSCAMFFRTAWLEPIITQKEAVESDILRYKKLMISNCNLFENVWLKDNSKYLFGDSLSIADLLATTELEQPRIAGYDPRENRAKLAAYMSRVREATHPFYDEAHAFLNRIIENAQQSKL